MKIFIGLVHYPVLNRQGEKICSAVTNLDIHDISRCAVTYGVERFFIITPSSEQQALVKRVSHHWKKGAGASFNPDRKRAFSLLELSSSLDEVIDALPGTRRDKIVIATTARDNPGCLSWKNFEKLMQTNEFECILLLFGTASGLHEECLAACDSILCPITGGTDYNHLSVRSAVAITLDRISRFRRN